MHIAADSGNVELINSLLKAGADPNVSDEVRQILFLNLLNHNLLLLVQKSMATKQPRESTYIKTQ